MNLQQMVFMSHGLVELKLHLESMKGLPLWIIYTLARNPSEIEFYHKVIHYAVNKYSFMACGFQVVVIILTLYPIDEHYQVIGINNG